MVSLHYASNFTFQQTVADSSKAIKRSAYILIFYLNYFKTWVISGTPGARGMWQVMSTGRKWWCSSPYNLFSHVWMSVQGWAVIRYNEKSAQMFQWNVASFNVLLHLGLISENNLDLKIMGLFSLSVSKRKECKYNLKHFVLLNYSLEEIVTCYRISFFGLEEMSCTIL